MVRQIAMLYALVFTSHLLLMPLVDLAARVTSGLEPYVPLSAWVTAKQAQTRSAKRLAGMFCHIFGEPAQHKD